MSKVVPQKVLIASLILAENHALEDVCTVDYLWGGEFRTKPLRGPFKYVCILPSRQYGTSPFKWIWFSFEWRGIYRASTQVITWWHANMRVPLQASTQCLQRANEWCMMMLMMPHSCLHGSTGDSLVLRLMQWSAHADAFTVQAVMTMTIHYARCHDDDHSLCTLSLTIMMTITVHAVIDHHEDHSLYMLSLIITMTIHCTCYHSCDQQ